MTTQQVQRTIVNGINTTALQEAISGIDDTVPPGYERLHYMVRIDGDGSREQFEQIHAMVQRTSPNYYNMANPIQLTSELQIG